MRTALKGQVGAGWSVRDVLGKVQISVVIGSQRTTVVTDLEWLGSSQAPLLTQLQMSRFGRMAPQETRLAECLFFATQRLMATVLK